MKLNRQSSIPPASPGRAGIALSPEEYLLVLAARVEIDSDDDAKMEDILRGGVEWPVVEASARRLGVEPLLYKHLSQEKYVGYVHDEMLHRLKESYHKQSMRSLRIYGQLSRILDGMNQADIPIILLKGAYLAKWIYGDIALRPMGDIDILCRDGDRGAVQEILRGLGYEEMKNIAQSRFHEEISSKIGSHLPPFTRKNAVRVEIHTDIFTKAPHKTTEMERVWEAIIPLNLDGLETHTLSLEHQLLYLSIHLQKHLMSGVATLYWFCDIHEFIRHYRDKINWNQFQAIAESLGVASQIAPLHDLLYRHWGMDIPENAVLSPSADFDRLSLESAIGGNKSLGKQNFLPSRIRLLRDIRNEDGLGKGLYYVLRHLFPARSHIINRYNPKNQREIYGYYISHCYWRFRHAFTSLFLIVRGVLQKRKRSHERERFGDRL
ncbi:MAG: nucleotidyltransferase family protein [Thermodesulfobacteriota bacterium]|nr:nucleotidyltransferase family protein [Thermodesulfobacteriota bacterium]